MTAYERLKEDVEKQEKSIKTIIEMLGSKDFPYDSAKSRLDDIEEKINKMTAAFFEEIYEPGVDPTKSKSRIEGLEWYIQNVLYNPGTSPPASYSRIQLHYDKQCIINKRINTYMDRSWWRKFFGIGSPKINIKLAIGSRK